MEFLRPAWRHATYFNRYSEDAVDLCDVLSSFSSQGKATLHEMSRVMGLPGKPSGIHGGEVERYYREGKIHEIADYCESDVVNTYRVWLRYELFRGRLTEAAFRASEANLVDYVRSHAEFEAASGRCDTVTVAGLCCFRALAASALDEALGGATAARTREALRLVLVRNFSGTAKHPKRTSLFRASSGYRRVFLLEHPHF